MAQPVITWQTAVTSTGAAATTVFNVTGVTIGDLIVIHVSIRDSPARTISSVVSDVDGALTNHAGLTWGAQLSDVQAYNIVAASTLR